MTQFWLVAEPAADLDVIAAFEWYEASDPGWASSSSKSYAPPTIGFVEGPFRYQDLTSGIRRALLRRFPYSVYFAVEGEVIVVLAILHAHRDTTIGSRSSAGQVLPGPIWPRWTAKYANESGCTSSRVLHRRMTGRLD